MNKLKLLLLTFVLFVSCSVAAFGQCENIGTFGVEVTGIQTEYVFVHNGGEIAMDYFVTITTTSYYDWCTGNSWSETKTELPGNY